ncbi:MAG: heme ABC exporter ATP-binding protein CcmA [bacterium]|nr:heme ABC exporter ATP-binding protein CcmA [bacterium]
MNAAPLLQIAQVRKDFGYKRILKDVSFDLNAGDFTLLLGQNGAGKSTLLKILSGLMRPSQGEVFYRGANLKEDPQLLRQDLGVIGHHPQVYGDLSAFENLLFFAKLRHLKDPKALVEDALERVDLARFKNAQVKNFSSGMFKRMGIARLMISRPRLLLLDEPYTGLDYKSVDFFNRFLVDFARSGGAILMVTHQLDVCFEISSRIAILEQGCITEDHPRSSFNYQELIDHYQRATQ